MLATPIEQTRDNLYVVLQALGPGWHDRVEIATKINKKTLNPVDMAALDLLVAADLVEKVNQPIPKTGRGSNLTRIVYRIKGSKSK